MCFIELLLKTCANLVLLSVADALVELHEGLESDEMVELLELEI